MEEGFAMLDATPLGAVTGKMQYYLFRIPLEVSGCCIETFLCLYGV